MIWQVNIFKSFANGAFQQPRERFLTVAMCSSKEDKDINKVARMALPAAKVNPVVHDDSDSGVVLHLNLRLVHLCLEICASV